jgi:hypothetical protein
LSQPIALGDSDSLKLILTTQEARSAKRPHQAFLLLKDSQNGLDISYPLSVKDSGKSKVELVSAHAQRWSVVVRVLILFAILVPERPASAVFDWF